MAESRLTIVLLILVATGMAGAIIVLSTWAPRLLDRNKITKTDRTPYECGIAPYERISKSRFSVHFYLVAMLFILFDIEAAFLFPWAVTFRDFAADKLFVLGEMGVFLGILVLGFIYVWKRGALEWE